MKVILFCFFRKNIDIGERIHQIIYKIGEYIQQKTAILASKKGLNLNEVVKEALSYVVKHEEVLD